MVLRGKGYAVHNVLERYAWNESPIHALDARVKVVSLLGLLVAVVLSRAPLYSEWVGERTLFFLHATQYAIVLLVLVCLLILARVPLRFVLTRTLMVMPFVGGIALFIPFFGDGKELYTLGPLTLTLSPTGLDVLTRVTSKGVLAVLCVVVLTSTTPFHDILRALEHLRVPRIYLMVMTFMYRYLFLLVEEITTMKRAWESRTVRERRWLGSMWHIRTAGMIIASLFLRSYERGERVYAAMLSRGYKGELPTLESMPLQRRDVVVGGIVLLVGLGTLGSEHWLSLMGVLS